MIREGSILVLYFIHFVKVWFYSKDTNNDTSLGHNHRSRKRGVRAALSRQVRDVSSTNPLTPTHTTRGSARNMVHIPSTRAPTNILSHLAGFTLYGPVRSKASPSTDLQSLHTSLWGPSIERADRGERFVR